jgi:cell division protein FtsQ
LLRIAAAAVVLATGGQLMRQAARSCPHFVLNNIEVVGTEASRASDIRDLTGVSVGTNTWDVDLEAVRERVLSHPWVASARVKRRLPHGLVVTVREHRAIAVTSLGEAVYAVDRRGGIFAPVDAEANMQLPLITGVPEPGLSDAAPRADTALRQTAALIRILRRHHNVAEVHIDREAGVTVREGTIPDVPIHFGWGDWKRKRRRLDAVLALWSGRESQLEAVNLTFEDQVVVRLRGKIDASEPAV